MDGYRFILGCGLLALVLAAAGCVSEDVVYVDEQGRELAVDAAGQPILPGGIGTGRAPALVSEPTEWPDAPPADLAPAAPTQRVATQTAPSKPAATSAPTGDASEPPAPDPTWNLPDTRGIPPSAPARAPTPAPTPKPAKKLDSSSGLDLPPAG